MRVIVFEANVMGVVIELYKQFQKNLRVQVRPLKRVKEQARRALRRKEKRISSSQLPCAYWLNVNTILLFLASRLRVRLWRPPRLLPAVAQRMGLWLWLTVAHLHRRQ
jgi:hypothetical protein